MQIKTERLTIRPWRGEDLASLCQLANNRKIAKNLRDRFPHPYTREDGQWWINFASGRQPTTNFALEFEGQAVGGIGLIVGEDVFRLSAEIGYWLGEPFWGQGLMAEAVQAFTAYVFAHFDFVRLHAGVFESNPASAKVLEKSGYVLESRMKKSVIKDGQLLDQLVYVMMR